MEIAAASGSLCQQLVEVKAERDLVQPETDQMVALAVELAEMALALEEQQHRERAITAETQLLRQATAVAVAVELQP
jgi:peptidoglycan hydrolase CwlO-like protein